MYNLLNVLCNEELSCEECNFKTSDYAHLEDHIRNIHQDGEVTVIKDTPEEDEITEITMMGEKCKLCEYVASNDEELTDHLMSSHVESK